MSDASSDASKHRATILVRPAARSSPATRSFAACAREPIASSTRCTTNASSSRRFAPVIAATSIAPAGPVAQERHDRSLSDPGSAGARSRLRQDPGLARPATRPPNSTPVPRPPVPARRSAAALWPGRWARGGPAPSSLQRLDAHVQQAGAQALAALQHAGNPLKPCSSNGLRALAAAVREHVHGIRTEDKAAGNSQFFKGPFAPSWSSLRRTSTPSPAAPRSPVA